MDNDKEIRALEQAHARLRRMTQIREEIRHGDQTNLAELNSLIREHYHLDKLSGVCPTCGRPR